MIFYFSKMCPHSLSLMEILGKYQTFMPVEDIQFVDMDENKNAFLITRVPVVPGVEVDGNLHFGDYAFDYVQDLQCKRVNNTAEGVHPSPATRTQAVTVTPQPDKPASKSVKTLSASLFDNEPMIPTKK
jgi:hypothetical protein